MTDSSQKGQWESKSPVEKAKDRYQYGGSRYSLRGVAHSKDDQYIPQISSLFPFPKDDIQDDGQPPDINTG